MYEQLIIDEDEGKLQFELYKCIYYFPVPSRPLVFSLFFFLSAGTKSALLLFLGWKKKVHLPLPK